jgi:glycosyltransferase involved in cell wall biosynthesis
MAMLGNNTAPCRVVHMTSVHVPFDTRIFHKECKTLAMAGYDVTLIAPHAGGDVIKDGVKLRAVAPPRNRRQRMLSTIWQVYSAAVREDAAIYHFHDPELMPVGALLRMRGKRVIYDVHEDYSGTMEGKQWLPASLHRPAAFAVRLCERLLSMSCNRVIAVTPRIAGKFQPGKTRIVQNLPWSSELCCAGSIPYEEREPIMVYVGWLSDARGVHEMSEAVRLASREMPVKLQIAGGVHDGAKARFGGARENGLVEFLGHLNRTEVAQLLGRARAGLILHHPRGNYLDGQPTKLFEYMSAGLPVVASNIPVCRQIVEPAECGLLADPLNPRAIADALLWLLRHPAEAAQMGRNGQRAVLEKYNWERESEGLIAAYSELAGEARPQIQNPPRSHGDTEGRYNPLAADQRG